MKAKKALAMLLCASMVISTISMGALAADENPDVMPISETTETAPVSTLPSDAAASWAAKSFERWSANGIVKGDENGNMNPDAELTRGELAQVFVSLFGLTEKAENIFADLKGDEWYADAILKCVAAGIMKGDGVNCNAQAKSSRGETMVMFGRGVGVQPDAKPDLSKFSDAASVPDWAAGYLAPLAAMGIVSGGGDGTINATGEIDRASTMSLLDKTITVYVNAPGEYKIDNADGFVIVNVSAKEGEVVISGTAAGVAISAGTAEGKIVAKDLKADTVKVDGAAAVSVEGKSTVGEITANATGAITVAKGVTVDTVTANAAGTITNNGTIKELAANAAAKVDNKGTITKADIKADGVVLDGTKPKDIVVNEGTKNPTDSTGKEIPATPDKPTGGNGGGGYVDPYTHVKDETELTVALAGTATQIKLDADITLTKQILITRALTLDGGDKLITVPNDWESTIPAENCGILVMSNNVTLQNIKVSGPDKVGADWAEGQYGIQVFNAKGVTLNNVAVTKANAGILINSATVTMTGKIDVSDNQFGGIEVAKGDTLDGTIPLNDPSLNISAATITNTTEVATTPTIWIDGELTNTTVVGHAKLIEMENSSKGQIFFFLNAVNEATLKTALAGEASTVNISDTIGSTSDYGVYTVDRAVTIKGGTVYGSFIVKADGATFDGVTMYNKYVDGGQSTSATKNAINAYANTLTVKGCTFYGEAESTVYEPNGIVVFPKGDNGTYTITGNTFNNYKNPAGSDVYLSAAIFVAEEFPMTGKPFFFADQTAASGATSTKAGTITLDANTYSDCAYGYVRMDSFAGDNAEQHVVEATVCNAAALTHAVTYAKSEATVTVKLGDNINLAEGLTTNKNVTLDLNGKTLASTYGGTVPYGAVDVTAGTLTVKDSATNGKLTAKGASGNTVIVRTGATFVLESGTVENTTEGRNVLRSQGGNITVDGGTVQTENGFGIVIFGKVDKAEDRVITVSGGTITAGMIAISSMGTKNSCENYTINITGGEIISTATDGDATAIYLPGTGGVTNISGGTITGVSSGISIRTGELNITGGTITATAARNTDGLLVNGQAGTVTGAVVIGKPATTSADDYAGDITVTIGEDAEIVNTTGDKVVIDARNNPVPNTVKVVGLTSDDVIITSANEYTKHDGGGTYTLESNPAANL